MTATTALLDKNELALLVESIQVIDYEIHACLRWLRDSLHIDKDHAKALQAASDAHNRYMTRILKHVEALC